MAKNHRLKEIIQSTFVGLLIVICLISNLSCKKLLDAKPSFDITTPSTPQDLQALLDNSLTMNSRTPGYDEASADDYFLTPENFAILNLRAQDAYLWKSNINEFANDWSKAAEVIYNSNICLEAIETIDRNGADVSQLNNIKGSALFFRAMSWLKLLWTHAQAYNPHSSNSNMGIILRQGSDFNVPSTRASVEECYRKLISDLNIAAPLLPDNPQHVLRPSKAAAYALMARAYLSMSDYTNALLNANRCLNIKSNLIDYNTIDMVTNAPFQSYNPEVIFHSDISAYSYFNISPLYASVDSGLYQNYDPNDLRKSIYFARSGKYQMFKGTYLSRALGSNALFTGIATDEVILIKAECLARANQTEEAMTALNTLLKKRWKNTVPYIPLTAADKEEALSIILKERRKELLLRGLRWVDIKRLNLDGANIILKRKLNGEEYTLQPNAEKFALPLPNDIVMLSGVSQNPGW